MRRRGVLFGQPSRDGFMAAHRDSDLLLEYQAVSGHGEFVAGPRDDVC